MKVKPILILPCSAAKLDYPAEAMDLYQGKGYLSVVKKHSKQQLFEAFNVFFVSAKYGLISANKIIKPYEQIMTNEIYNQLINEKDFSAKALSLLVQCQTKTIYSIMPKKYQKVLELWLTKSKFEFEVNKPEPGSGIGSQRGYLSRVLVLHL